MPFSRDNVVVYDWARIITLTTGQNGEELGTVKYIMPSALTITRGMNRGTALGYLWLIRLAIVETTG